MIIIGIDPGAHCGFALYIDGKLKQLMTYSSLDALFLIRDGMLNGMSVVIEDSRKQKNNFRDKEEDNKKVAFAKGRSVGQVDCLCKLLEAAIDPKKTQMLLLSPKDKGAKIKERDQFKLKTGWSGRSNQHEKDAAIVAHPYRWGFKTQ